MEEHPRRELYVPGADLADEVDDEEEHLPHKEEVVVEQVDRHPEREGPVPMLIERFVQRRQHPREESHHVYKVVEEDVVDRKAREGVEAGPQQGKVCAADIAAQPAVSSAPRHRELEDEKRHHQIGQSVLREEQ